MNRKPRLLFVNEAHFLSTGYAVYGKNLLEKLHKSGKYEICELGCYGEMNDPRAMECPWAFVGNLPDRNNQDEINKYQSDPINQFGKFRFEETCLRFRPDHVFSITDHWMHNYQAESPFRRFFTWSLMPTCDAEPQSEDWIATYIEADNVFAYNDWSGNVLKEQSNGKINYLGSAPPGIELDVMRPILDKKGHRQRMGFRDDVFVVGMVSRNQARKLYPDLFEAFYQFYQTAPAELANKTFLYVHSTMPDIGWNFPLYLKKYGLTSKVLFTYGCQSCSLIFPAFYSDVRHVCPRCKQNNASFPSTQNGISREALGGIYNLMDVYIQYANSEGAGMGQGEAAANGVPIMSVNYSAMEDYVDKLKGIPVAVKSLRCEAETGCYRAVPDNEDFVKKLISFLQLPDSVRNKKRFEVRKAAEQHYSWEASAKKWMQVFDKTTLRDESSTWFSPPQIMIPNKNFPTEQQSTNEQFLNWAFVNTLGRPELIGSHFYLRLLKDLYWGASQGGFGGILFNENSHLGQRPQFQPCNREMVVGKLAEMRDYYNFWERRRMEINQGSR